MKNRILYLFVFLIMIIGGWVSISMYMGVMNPGTFISLVSLVLLIAIPISSIIRKASYKIWVSIGFITLVTLFAPISDFAELLIISLAMIIAALLINANLQIRKKGQDSSAKALGNVPAQSQKPDTASIIILALIVLLLAKAFYSFYWFMIWDSTTDSLDWLWLPTPILAILFSSFLLYFLLPNRSKPKGFLYLMMIPILFGVFYFAEQVDFRQLTNQRAEQVSQLIENYHARVGRYPDSLQELTSWYTLSIPEPVIIYGQDWCYDGGVDYYRLGYFDREHWSSPNLIEQIYKMKGAIPGSQRVCEAEAMFLIEHDSHNFLTFEDE